MKKINFSLRAISALLAVLLLFNVCFIGNVVFAANEDSKVDISELSATASSELSGAYVAANAIDGVVAESDTSEWHSAGQNFDEWLRVGFKTTKALTKIVIHGRDAVYEGIKFFINDSDVPLGGNMYSQIDTEYIDIPNTEARERITTISFVDTIENVDSIKIQGYNESRGFFVVKEVEFYEIADIDYSLSPKAIWASSVYLTEVPSNATDGNKDTMWHTQKGEGHRIALNLGNAESYKINAIDLFASNRSSTHDIKIYTLSTLPEEGFGGDLGQPFITVDPNGKWVNRQNFKIEFENYAEGKYIVIESDGDNDGFLQINEIKVTEFDPKFAPQAIWSSSFASSDFHYNAIDGNNDTKWHSQQGSDHRIVIKLGNAASYKIDAINLLADNRCAINPIKVYALSILPEDLSGALGNPVLTVEPNGKWNKNENFKIEFGPFVEAKYIVLESKGDNDGFFQINEINITEFDAESYYKFAPEAIWASSRLTQAHDYDKATDEDNISVWHSKGYEDKDHRIALKLGNAEGYQIDAINLLADNRCAINPIKVYALSSLPEDLSGDLGEPVLTVDPNGKWNKNENFKIEFGPFVEAKYIVLESKGDNDGFFQINEITVTEFVSEDYYKLSPEAIWASSQFTNCVPGNATDGDKGTIWHSQAGQAQRIALNLGNAESYKVSAIELYASNRAANHEIKVYAFDSLPEDLNGNLGEPAVTIDPNGKWHSGTLSINFKPFIKTKYIVLESDGDGDNFFQINEIAVTEYAPKKVACIGDSLTLGVGGTDFLSFENGTKYPYGSSKDDGWIEDSYPAKLSELLGYKYEVRNFGVGSSSLMSASNIPWTTTKQYNASIEWNPDVVIIMLGTNDSIPSNWQYKDQYLKDYIDLINTYKALPSNPDVYVALSLATNLTPGSDYVGITEEVILNEIIPLQIAAAKETGAYIIDTFSVNSENKAELYYDGVHPNGKGYANVAAKVYDEMVNKAKIKIMPLGDSITHGFNVPGGYKIKLWQKFEEAGLSNYVDFVGSVTDTDEGLSDILGDLDHEGHPGWKIADIDANINGWMDTYTPDIVMLQIGTNDIGHGADMSTAADRLSSLIDNICAKLPKNGKLYVASITPIAEGLNGIENVPELVNTFNQEIPALVNAKHNEGKSVYFMDMYSLLTVDDLADGLHPSRKGYDKMGEGWFETVKNDVVSVKTADIKAAPVNTVNEKIASIDLNPEDNEAEKQNIIAARAFYTALNATMKKEVKGYENLKLAERDILGKVNPDDLDITYLVWAKKVLLLDENKSAADFNNDGNIDICDFIYLKKFLSK